MYVSYAQLLPTGRHHYHHAGWLQVSKFPLLTLYNNEFVLVCIYLLASLFVYRIACAFGLLCSIVCLLVKLYILFNCTTILMVNKDVVYIYKSSSSRPVIMFL